MQKSIFLLLGFFLISAVNAQTERTPRFKKSIRKVQLVSPASKNTKEATRGVFGISYNYILSSQKTNTSPSNTLFGGNGHSFNLSFNFGNFKTKGSKSGVSADSNGQISDRNIKDLIIPYPSNKTNESQRKVFDENSKISWEVQTKMQFGKTSTKELEAFAKTLTTPLNYRITQSSSDWQQFVVMAGPKLNIGKKEQQYKHIIGVGFGVKFKVKPNRIIIEKIDGQATPLKVFDETEKKISFAWQVYASIPVVKLGKRTNLCLEGGYGFNGASFGVKLGYTNKQVVERIIKTSN